MPAHELVREAHRAGVTAPIVVATMMPPSGAEARALQEDGVDHVLARPFGPDELERVVEAFCEPRCAAAATHAVAPVGHGPT